jgi:FkbM family methyltransferase
MGMGLEVYLLSKIAANSGMHARGSSWYASMEEFVNQEMRELHNNKSDDRFEFAELGSVAFPYFKMGNIDSSALFGLDELIIFSYYYANRNRYKNVLDLGANIGLHTLLMKKLGFETISYEPDLVHLSQIARVLELNGFSQDGVRRKAISNQRGALDYLRVLGNTTGSHLLGSKEGVYGATEIVEVEVDDILDVLQERQFDFVKMDVEGHEVVLLDRITSQSLQRTDVMLEIGSEKNAIEIFQILKEKEIPGYSQKTNWQLVQSLGDLPSHHTHGSLFLSMQGAPKWK